MNMTIVAILTILCYFAAVTAQFLSVNGKLRNPKWWVFGFGVAAISLHAVILHAWIDMTSGQNLTLMNMFSLIIWWVSILILAVSLIRRIEVLVTITFPLAIFSILFVLLFPQQFIEQTAQHPHTLFHILLATFTFGVLFFAGLLAVLLAVQERMLRTKRVSALWQKAPPMETMENLLFRVITLGFILLSVVVISSLYSYHNMIWMENFIWQKSVAVLVAWVVFAVLLLGRYRWGWRGRTAIQYTLSGVTLLLLVYCLSSWVL